MRRIGRNGLPLPLKSRKLRKARLVWARPGEGWTEYSAAGWNANQSILSMSLTEKSHRKVPPAPCHLKFNSSTSRLREEHESSCSLKRSQAACSSWLGLF